MIVFFAGYFEAFFCGTQLGARPLLPAQQRADRERHDEDEEADGEEDDESYEECREARVNHGAIAAETQLRRRSAAR